MNGILKIGDGGVKIALMKTVPGYEGKVKDKLEEACKKSPAIKDFVTFKGLGTFDIILIYSTEDFGSHLREAGTIDYILQSNLLLCFPYLNKNYDGTSIEDIFQTLKQNSFTSFSLLKISPGIKKRYPKIDKLILEHMASGSQRSYVLGTLGWNELILMDSTNNVNELYRDIHKIGSIYYQPRIIRKRLSVVLKTFSFIGINNEILPPTWMMKMGFKAIYSFLKKRSGLDVIINSNGANISPSVEITLKNIYTYKITRYFEQKNFKTSCLLGKTDIIAKPNSKEMKWSFFLAALLYFRHHYKKKIFSTSTKINFTAEPEEVNLDDLPELVKPFKFKFTELEGIFNKNMASNLANQLYTLNSLFQNPLGGSSYVDMVKYPKYIYTIGNGLKKSKRSKFALVSGYVLGRGAELRSYGTYETIEEVTGRFSEFKGGCQLAILAVELIPSVVLEECGLEWFGFVTVTGEPKFSHIHEVINITPESLLNPKSWWALYHEIGHIIIERNVELVEKNPALDQYLANCLNPGMEESLIVELVAEVIGFELGLFGDFDFYFKNLWNYLAELEPEMPLSDYTVRSFFMEVFHGHFRSDTTIDKIYKRDIEELDTLYEKFLKHINRIEDTIGEGKIKDKHFIIAENVKRIKDLYEISSHVSRCLLGMKARPKKITLDSSNTKEVLNSLKNGEVWWGSIDSPRAILYHIVQSENIDFKTKLATIVSFWNSQNLRYQNRSK